MLIPIFNTYEITEFEYKEAFRIGLSNTGPVVTQTTCCKLKPNMFQYRGTVMRLLLKAPQTGSVNVTGAYIGKSAVSGESAGFNGSPTQITYNGSGSFNIPPEGLTTDVINLSTEDEVPFTWAFNIVSSKMMRAFPMEVAASLRPPGYKAGDIVHYGKQGVAEAGTINKTGFGASPDICTMVGSVLVA